MLSCIQHSVWHVNLTLSQLDSPVSPACSIAGARWRPKQTLALPTGRDLCTWHSGGLLGWPTPAFDGIPELIPGPLIARV